MTNGWFEERTVFNSRRLMDGNGNECERCEEGVELFGLNGKSYTAPLPMTVMTAVRPSNWAFDTLKVCLVRYHHCRNKRLESRQSAQSGERAAWAMHANEVEAALISRIFIQRFSCMRKITLRDKLNAFDWFISVLEQSPQARIQARLFSLCPNRVRSRSQPISQIECSLVWNGDYRWERISAAASSCQLPTSTPQKGVRGSRSL